MLTAVALWPAVAEAHGGVTEFRKELAGPYEVAFLSVVALALRTYFGAKKAKRAS